MEEKKYSLGFIYLLKGVPDGGGSRHFVHKLSFIILYINFFFITENYIQICNDI